MNFFSCNIFYKYMKISTHRQASSSRSGRRRTAGGALAASPFWLSWIFRRSSRSKVTPSNGSEENSWTKLSQQKGEWLLFTLKKNCTYRIVLQLYEFTNHSYGSPKFNLNITHKFYITKKYSNSIGIKNMLLMTKRNQIIQLFQKHLKC